MNTNIMTCMTSTLWLPGRSWGWGWWNSERSDCCPPHIHRSVPWTPLHGSPAGESAPALPWLNWGAQTSRFSSVCSFWSKHQVINVLVTNNNVEERENYIMNKFREYSDRDSVMQPFSGLFDKECLYSAPSMFSTLTNLPVPAAKKHPRCYMMLPLPCFTRCYWPADE